MLRRTKLNLQSYWCRRLLSVVELYMCSPPSWPSGGTCRKWSSVCRTRPSTTFTLQTPSPSRSDTFWQSGSRVKDGRASLRNAHLHVTLRRTVRLVSVSRQGRSGAWQRGEGRPSSSSAGADHQLAAVHRPSECQRRGQDEADADQQEHGRRPFKTEATWGLNNITDDYRLVNVWS